MQLVSLLKRLNRVKQETSVNTISNGSLATRQSAPLLQLINVSYQLSTGALLDKVSASAQTKHTKRTKHHNIAEPRSDALVDLAGRQTLVKDIDLTIMPGDKISIIGPNGAGKSTLVKLILGLITPTAGNIVKGNHLSIGYVPQKFAVPTILPLRVCDLLGQVTASKALNTHQQQDLYDRLSISPLLLRQVTHLSGGETQRVLLTRALLSRPNLLILDEPMQGLDPESENWLYQFIDDLPDFLHCAMVVVSHDLHWVMQGSRHVVCLNKHICCEGQPSELSVSQEFKRLFGHEFEQPYLHQPHSCYHKVAKGSVTLPK